MYLVLEILNTEINIDFRYQNIAVYKKLNINLPVQMLCKGGLFHSFPFFNCLKIAVSEGVLQWGHAG